MSTLAPTRSLLMLVLLAFALFTMPEAQAQPRFLVFVVSGSAQSSPVEVARILERRFDEIRPGFLTTISAHAEGQRITLRFTGWFPSIRQIDYLTRVIGRLQVLFPEQPNAPWITESDITDAQPIFRGPQAELAIRLTDAAAVRVAEESKRRIGQTVVMIWDGKPLIRLRIHEALPRSIALSVHSLDEARLMSAVLRGGRLPDDVVLTQAPSP